MKVEAEQELRVQRPGQERGVKKGARLGILWWAAGEHVVCIHFEGKFIRLFSGLDKEVEKEEGIKDG